VFLVRTTPLGQQAQTELQFGQLSRQQAHQRLKRLFVLRALLRGHIVAD